jgi:hypothetical protein
MNTDFEDLRALIAAQHKVFVGADDPILFLVTANEFCVARSVQLLEAHHAQTLAVQNQQLERAATVWLDAARATSQHTLERAATEIAASAQSASTSAQDALQTGVHALLKPIRLLIAVSIFSSLFALLACALLWLR